MIIEKPVVFIVEDDESVRTALKRLMKSAGLRVRAFSSAEDFLNQESQNIHGCLILDLKMPGMNGLELQEKLAKSGSTMPIIFISAYQDVTAREQAMKAGAEAFLQKPFEDQILFEKVNSILNRIKIGQNHQEDDRD
ncbi:MAG: response regulator transcription factor [Planctomycetota bacterium]|jgi:FixJ family two-component response regulator